MNPLFRPLLTLAVWLALLLPCTAHPLLQNRMWILLTPETARIAVDVSLKELSTAQLLPAADDGSIDPDLLANAADYHADYVLRHLHVEAGGNPLTGTVTQVSAPPQIGGAEETFYQYELAFPTMGKALDSLRVSHTMLREFPYSPGQAWDVTYNIRWKREGEEVVRTSLLRMGDSADFPLAATSVAEAVSGPVEVNVTQTLREYFWHGVIHILTGYDHLLFVAALVLATVTFWELVKVILAFTLAHTLTLTLSVLGLVRLPEWIVEPVIAASIVFVALENLLFPKRVQSWVRLGVAFGFGLIHGLGFAGGLMDAMQDLPALGLGLAIVAFSLGVEVAHQVVVLPLWGFLRVGRGMWTAPVNARVLRFGSMLISLGGMYFLFHAVSEAI